MKKPKSNYSRKLIQDEFTPLKVSRGRKWQLRRVKAGLCIRCNNPVAPGQELCVEHKVKAALAHRKKLNSPRRHKGKWVDLANVFCPPRKKRSRHRVRPPAQFEIENNQDGVEGAGKT
jgi:hypothetical protein